MEKLFIYLLFGCLCLDSLFAQSCQYSAINCRKHSAVLTDFGGKGDGKTLNTAAFQAAIAKLSKVAADGGALLVVPPGKWLTGSFNLTSQFTLYIHKDAVILASKNEADYPLVDPLPSYGRGRDAVGKRFASLISGANLTDVVITGGNGTIDGQGRIWWEKFKAKELNHTRPYLIEIINSTQVQISNLTLTNSPSWHVHPVYCNNVIVEGLTIIAPVEIPNTDGINPDSCINTRIRDTYIVSGDDCIAVKSGWDQYGIRFGMPTKHLSIKRLTCVSPDSAVIALGSEMSGGIQDIRAEDIIAINSQSGIRIKTAPGRGAYVKDVYVKNFKMHTMKYAFWMAGNYNQHPDEGYDPKALPTIKNINYRDMVGENVSIAGSLAGIEGDPFTDICISNVTLQLATKSNNLLKKSKKLPWNCTDIAGFSSRVSPQPCDLLADKGKAVDCDFPVDTLPIDDVQLQTCRTNSVFFFNTIQ